MNTQSKSQNGLNRVLEKIQQKNDIQLPEDIAAMLRRQ